MLALGGEIPRAPLSGPHFGPSSPACLHRLVRVLAFSSGFRQPTQVGGELCVSARKRHQNAARGKSLLDSFGGGCT